MCWRELMLKVSFRHTSSYKSGKCYRICVFYTNVSYEHFAHFNTFNTNISFLNLHNIRYRCSSLIHMCVMICHICRIWRREFKLKYSFKQKSELNIRKMSQKMRVFRYICKAHYCSF